MFLVSLFLFVCHIFGLLNVSTLFWITGNFQHLTSSVASEIGRSLRGEVCVTVCTLLMFRLTPTNTLTVKEKGLLLNRLLSRTQKRRCTKSKRWKELVEKPKEPSEARVTPLRTAVLLWRWLTLQLGFEERCLPFYIFTCLTCFLLWGSKSKRQAPTVREEMFVVLPVSGAKGTTSGDLTKFTRQDRRKKI